MLMSHLEYGRPKADKVSQKTLFVIKKLGLSIRKDEPHYYKGGGKIYYENWKKTLLNFYSLNNKNINNEISEKGKVELQKVIQKLTKANIL